MKRLHHIILILAAVLLVAADKKPEKAKEPAPSAAQIQLWIKQLGDENFHVREDATKNLIKAGWAAFHAVTKATKSEDFEVKQRALMTLKVLHNTVVAYFPSDYPGGKFKITPEKYDVLQFKKFKGPSTRIFRPMKDDFPFYDWGPTKENIEMIDRVLSSLKIEFYLHIEEVPVDWILVKEMIIVVSQSRAQDAYSALRAATKAKLLKTLPIPK